MRSRVSSMVTTAATRMPRCVAASEDLSIRRSHASYGTGCKGLRGFEAVGDARTMPRPLRTSHEARH
jgi:hypothetical protein